MDFWDFTPSGPPKMYYLESTAYIGGCNCILSMSLPPSEMVVATQAHEKTAKWATKKYSMKHPACTVYGKSNHGTRYASLSFAEEFKNKDPPFLTKATASSRKANYVACAKLGTGDLGRFTNYYNKDSKMRGSLREGQQTSHSACSTV